MATKVSAAGRRQIFAVLDDTARSVEHLHVPTLRKILPALKQAHDELEKQLGHWLSREDGEARFTTQRYRNALVAVRHAWATVNRLDPTIDDALWTGADAAGKLSTHNLIRELQRFEQIFEGTIRPVAIEQGAIIAEGDKLLWRRFESAASKFPHDVQQRIIDELAVSRFKGETIFEVTNRLQKRLPAIYAEDRWSAERLSRTETMNAYSIYNVQGLKQLNEEDPEILSRWDGSFDWRRCRMCGSLDGQVRDVANGEKFVADWFTKSKRGAKHHVLSIERPPGHPCCFVPGTPVLTPGGWRPIESLGPGDSVVAHDGRPHAVVRRFESRFVGTMCKITSGQQVVYATPNHPMAAEDRWVRADSLDVKRDQLWVLEASVDVTDHGPADRSHEFFRRAVLGELFPGMVPGSAVDLHGEHRAFNGNVDVEPANRPLRGGRDSDLGERFEHRRFIRAIRSSLLRLRAALHLNHSLFAPFRRPIGGFGLGLDLAFGHAGVAPGVVVGDASHDPGFVQNPRDWDATASVSRGERDRGLPADVERDDFILRERQWPSHLFTLRRIDISPMKHTGVVHNLEVENAGTYIAGGFLVHNCRCVLTPWRSTWANVARAGAIEQPPQYDHPAKIAARSNL